MAGSSFIYSIKTFKESGQLFRLYTFTIIFEADMTFGIIVFNQRDKDILAFGSGALRKAVQEGDRNGSYMAGECAGMVKKIEPAKAIVEDLIIGAENVMKSVSARIN